MKTLLPPVALILAASCAAPPAGPADELASLRAVGPEGAGHERASTAWSSLVARGPAALLPTLAAFDGASPRATNWLRSAVDAICSREGASLDAGALEGFVRRASHSGEARFLAYEWLVRLDPTAPERLLPDMIEDPGRELRRAAIARAVERAAKNPEGQAGRYRRLLSAARERDQVDDLVKKLAKLNVEVDLQRHYGVVSEWLLITPFDNREMKGFDVAYPPEKGVTPGKPLKGKGGAEVRYVDHVTADPRGLVDLNKALGKLKGTIAYARAEVESAAERPVEIRVGTNNAVKIFLNGTLVFFRNEYHHGMRMDQYVARGTLRRGANEILLKVCQNEQDQNWAQRWSFQARICDALGGGVPFTAAGR